MSHALVCRAVSVDYGEVRALRDLDLSVATGETLALLGPSGSGKSTLMYALAGFVDISHGSIEICGEVASVPGSVLAPERRPVGMVFQNYALWPHLTAEDTVAYPIRRAGTDRSVARADARRLLGLVGVGDLAQRKPAEMSGGQQQRVGLARALAREAKLYLFDEPTAHLDSSVRAAVQEEIERRRRETGAAAVYSSHDATEALAIADRVAILRDGAVIQVGEPTAIYDQPVDVWAARLTGPASVFEVGTPQRTMGNTSGLSVTVCGQTVPVDISPGTNPTDPVRLLVRPEWIEPGGPIAGVVREVWFRGPHTDYRVDIGVGLLEARLTGPPRLAVGETSGWAVRRGWIPSGIASEHRSSDPLRKSSTSAGG